MKMGNVIVDDSRCADCGFSARRKGQEGNVPVVDAASFKNGEFSGLRCGVCGGKNLLYSTRPTDLPRGIYRQEDVVKKGSI